MNSFDEAILEEPERFIEYAFEENRYISDFGEFKNALDKGIHHEKGVIDEETFVKLFDNPETMKRIKENVSPKEYENLYGDGIIVQRMAISPTKMVVIRQKKIKMPSYTRAGRSVRAYNRGFKRWTPAEAKFLSVRKARKLTPKQIINEYNRQFKDTPRSSSSIKTKIYRL